jgi:hypothetical protein
VAIYGEGYDTTLFLRNKLKAYMTSPSLPKIKGEQVIIVSSLPPSEQGDGKIVNETLHMDECCFCCQKDTIMSIGVVLEKTGFFTNEKLKGTVKLDVSETNKTFERVSINLLQNMIG